MVNQEHRDHEVSKELTVLLEHQAKMVSMERMVTLVFLDALGSRVNAAPQESPALLAHPAQLGHQAPKVMLVHLASKEKRDGVGWMVLQEDQENLEIRARLDPKVKREMMDLLARKGIRAGLADQDYKDPRVNRVKKVPPEQTEWMALLD